MTLFTQIEALEHEQVIFGYDKASGLKAIVAIHNTQLGPGLGGTRLWPYKSEEEAITDVLRLARGMTYKNAAAGLDLGGGKAVIIAEPKDKSPELLKAYGRFIESIKGRYVTAADMNTNEADMDIIGTQTQFVSGRPQASGGSGDPSPFTALGVFEGIKACVKHQYQRDDLQDIHVAVQGLGSVGMSLCEHLHAAGARLSVADIYQDRVDDACQRFNATAVDIDAIHQVEAEVFSPCARGAIINDTSIDELNCKIIAGAANNQLQDETTHGEGLAAKGILYAPDYIINAGGVINISCEIGQTYSVDKATKKVTALRDTLLELFTIADQQHCTTFEAAQKLAETRLSR